MMILIGPWKTGNVFWSNELLFQTNWSMFICFMSGLSKQVIDLWLLHCMLHDYLYPFIDSLYPNSYSCRIMNNIIGFCRHSKCMATISLNRSPVKHLWIVAASFICIQDPAPINIRIYDSYQDHIAQHLHWSSDHLWSQCHRVAGLYQTKDSFSTGIFQDFKFAFHW